MYVILYLEPQDWICQLVTELLGKVLGEIRGMGKEVIVVQGMLMAFYCTIGSCKMTCFRLLFHPPLKSDSVTHFATSSSQRQLVY